MDVPGTSLPGRHGPDRPPLDPARPSSKCHSRQRPRNLAPRRRGLLPMRPRATRGRSGHHLCVPSRPGSAGQNEPVSVGVRDCDAPTLPVWIAGGDPRSSRVDQAADHIVVDHTIEVENQQVLIGWRSWCGTVWVTDKLQVPRRTRPSDHEQGMPPARRVIGPEQDIESKAVNPESLGGTQIVARPGNTQVTCWQRLHCSILAEPRAHARAGKMAVLGQCCSGDGCRGW
jgi:hypothetical protein